MSVTLQAVVVVGAVVALSIVAVDYLDVWKWDTLQTGQIAENDNWTSYATNSQNNILQNTVSVTGKAGVSVDPDILTISLGVQTQDETAQGALDSNSKIMKSVIQAVMDTGISKNEISTSTLNVYPIHGDYDSRLNLSPLVGFGAKNIILITSTKLDLTAPIIDNASSAGANIIRGISFTLSPELVDATQTMLLQDALMDAKEKANIILEPVNKSTGEMLSLDILPESNDVYGTQYFSRAESFSSVPVFSSQQKVTVDVYAVFAIQ